jgi:hypothetical protein
MCDTVESQARPFKARPGLPAVGLGVVTRDAAQDVAGNTVYYTGAQQLCCGVGARPGKKADPDANVDVQLGSGAKVAAESAALGVAWSAGLPVGDPVSNCGICSLVPYTLVRRTCVSRFPSCGCRDRQDDKGSLEGFVTSPTCWDGIKDSCNLCFCLACGPGTYTHAHPDISLRTHAQDHFSRALPTRIASQRWRLGKKARTLPIIAREL